MTAPDDGSLRYGRPLRCLNCKWVGPDKLLTRCASECHVTCPKCGSIGLEPLDELERAVWEKLQ